jgi:carbon monoxide dehydrogenase subunit G
MKIESKTVEVQAGKEKVFAFVSDLNNFEKLLPAERISEWESTADYCSFKVQGTATIDLKLKETHPHDRLLLESGEKSPFPFTLEIFFEESEGVTRAYQVMQADINPFLKMMVEKPLSNLFNYIADRLTEQVNSES